MDQVNRNSSYLGTYMSEFIGAGDWRLSFIHRDRVQAMTLDKVNAVLKRYFVKTNRTVGNFVPTKNPVAVGIEHTQGVDALVKNYKGKKGFDKGEAFDVSYDNIQNRLNTGKLSKSNIEYGFIKKNNRGKTVTLSFTFRNGSVKASNEDVTSDDLINSDDNSDVDLENIFFTDIVGPQQINRVTFGAGDVTFTNITLDLPSMPADTLDAHVNGAVPAGVTIGSASQANTTVLDWTWAAKAGMLNF